MKNKIKLCRIRSNIDSDAITDSSFLDDATSDDICCLLVRYLVNKHKIDSLKIHDISIGFDYEEV